MILRFLTTLYVLTRTKSATKYIILWKVIITSFKISNCFYLVIFHKINLRVLSMVTKMYIFFYVTPYIIFTPPVFLRLYWHIWHPWNISFPTIIGVLTPIIKVYTLQAMLCSIKIGVFFTILGYETLLRTSLWHMTQYFQAPIHWSSSYIDQLIE